MKGGGVNEGVVGAVWLIGIAASYADRGMSAELGARNLTVPACGILLALYGDRTVMTFQFLRELLGIDKTPWSASLTTWNSVDGSDGAVPQLTAACTCCP